MSPFGCVTMGMALNLSELGSSTRKLVLKDGDRNRLRAAAGRGACEVPQSQEGVAVRVQGVRASTSLQDLCLRRVPSSVRPGTWSWSFLFC